MNKEEIMGDTQIVQFTQEDIAQLKRGNHAAFKKLFKELFHHIRFFCEGIVKDPSEAEDIAVLSFMKYFERVEKFDSLDAIKAFLYLTARNSCYDYFDKKRAKQKYNRQYAYLTSEAMILEGARFGYEAIMFEQLFAAVIKEVENLPEQCRKVFKMIMFERIESEEVAELLHISPGTVRMHCSNAMKRLKVIFGEKELMLLSLMLFGFSNH
jgi:RNA polymerase sigma-70 factor (family 1)